MRFVVSCATLLALAAIPAVASGATVDRTEFRYVRALSGPGRAALSFEPDARLLSHASPGLADLRVVDGNGAQIPWRPLPHLTGGMEPVPLLNAGRRGSAAVALLDLGSARAIHDRVVLDVPQGGFVGRVMVFGSDRRSGPFTRLGATTIYDVSGAQHARSTVVVFAPTDFRYLSLRATGIRSISGAVVETTPARERLVARDIVKMTQVQAGRRTLLTLDLGFDHVPLHEVLVSSSTRRYERPVEISTSQDGVTFTPGAYGRIAAFPGSSPSPLEVDLQARYVRLEIDNGDDEPLRGLRARLFDVSHALLLEGGHPSPLTLYYGGFGIAPPDYDFARLPVSALDLDRLRVATLGAEAANASFRAPADTRSFTAKHDWLVDAALALAAVVVGGAGLVALRRRV